MARGYGARCAGWIRCLPRGFHAPHKPSKGPGGSWLQTSLRKFAAPTVLRPGGRAGLYPPAGFTPPKPCMVGGPARQGRSAIRIEDSSKCVRSLGKRTLTCDERCVPGSRPLAGRWRAASARSSPGGPCPGGPLDRAPNRTPPLCPRDARARDRVHADYSVGRS